MYIDIDSFFCVIDTIKLCACPINYAEFLPIAYILNDNFDSLFAYPSHK